MEPFQVNPNGSLRTAFRPPVAEEASPSRREADAADAERRAGAEALGARLWATPEGLAVRQLEADVPDWRRSAVVRKARARVDAADEGHAAGLARLQAAASARVLADERFTEIRVRVAAGDRRAADELLTAKLGLDQAISEETEATAALIERSLPADEMATISADIRQVQESVAKALIARNQAAARVARRAVADALDALTQVWATEAVLRGYFGGGGHPLGEPVPGAWSFCPKLGRITAPLRNGLMPGLREWLREMDGLSE